MDQELIVLVDEVVSKLSKESHGTVPELIDGFQKFPRTNSDQERKYKLVEYELERLQLATRIGGGGNLLPNGYYRYKLGPEGLKQVLSNLSCSRFYSNTAFEEKEKLTYQPSAMKTPTSQDNQTENDQTNDQNVEANPKVFISYAWEGEDLKKWVKKLASELRNIGIDIKLDQWEVVPGDRLTYFMEKSVRDNEYVLVICTPKYKEKSESRIGGVGYEGDIMTSEILQSSNYRKFIPILQSGNPKVSMPSWLAGNYYIDLSTEDHYSSNIEDLITTLFNKREIAPALGKIPDRYQIRTIRIQDESTTVNFEAVKIKGIIVDEVTTPSNNGKAGSSLYKIPFELNIEPPQDWVRMFIAAFNNPSEATTMHRPGIASIRRNKLILDGTTIEEVEKYHKKTLRLSVTKANEEYKALLYRTFEKDRKGIHEEIKHKSKILEASKRISFEDKVEQDEDRISKSTLNKIDTLLLSEHLQLRSEYKSKLAGLIQFYTDPNWITYKEKDEFKWLGKREEKVNDFHEFVRRKLYPSAEGIWRLSNRCTNRDIFNFCDKYFKALVANFDSTLTDDINYWKTASSDPDEKPFWLFQKLVERELLKLER